MVHLQRQGLRFRGGRHDRIANLALLFHCSFGKFGSHYLQRTFYFDVHPPLGKLLVGLSGYIAGYNGSFEFKSGEVYPPEIDFWTMRAFNAMFGVFLVPMA